MCGYLRTDFRNFTGYPMKKKWALINPLAAKIQRIFTHFIVSIKELGSCKNVVKFNNRSNFQIERIFTDSLCGRIVRSFWIVFYRPLLALVTPGDSFQKYSKEFIQLNGEICFDKFFCEAKILRRRMSKSEIQYSVIYERIL